MSANILFIETYTETDFFRGKVWVCQPKDRFAIGFNYLGGASGDTEGEAIAKCMNKYRDTHYRYHKVLRKGRLP